MIPLLLACGIAIGGRAPVDAEREALISRAMASVREGIPVAEGDPSRPGFHFRAPARWMNDPNGPVYYGGWYHLFYQFNPYGDQWGDMHWGHARSRDLVNWEHLPVALWPTKSRGEDHVFSGSTFLNDAGKPTIFYTSIGGRAPEQWSAAPTDEELIGWAKSPGNPVLSTTHHGETKIDEWRDPFLFRAPGEDGGGTYMLLGGAHEGRGIVALYRAKDAELTGGEHANWDYLGIVYRHPDAGLVECPNIARIGGKWVLLVSVHGRVEALVGQLDLEAREFRTERRSVLADGSYASQLHLDGKGRTIHWAWLRTTHHRGWNGCMTLPSVLTLGPDGTLRREPIEALETLRGRRERFAFMRLEGTRDFSDRVEGHAMEIVAEIDPGSATSVAFRIRGETISYDPKTRTLWTPGRFPVVLPEARKGRLKLRIFLDRSVLDVYADDGATTQISSVPFRPEERGLSLTAEGGAARIIALELYTMKPATFDSRRFR